MAILVAYGSKRGGTAGLAQMIGDALRNRGLEVIVHEANTVRSVEGIDGVVVVGALYMNRWHRQTRRFVRRHAAELRERAVWLVSSGPSMTAPTAARYPL